MDSYLWHFVSCFFSLSITRQGASCCSMCDYAAPCQGWALFPCVSVLHMSIHSAADGNLGGSDFLAVMNNAAMNTCAQAFMWICFQFSGYTPRSGLAASYYNCVHSLWNCQTVFQNNHTIFSSHQQPARVAITPCSRRHLLLSAW